MSTFASKLALTFWAAVPGRVADSLFRPHPKQRARAKARAKILTGNAIKKINEKTKIITGNCTKILTLLPTTGGGGPR